MRQSPRAVALAAFARVLATPPHADDARRRTMTSWKSTGTELLGVPAVGALRPVFTDVLRLILGPPGVLA